MPPILVLLVAQAMFTGGDVWARSVIGHQGFHVSTFLAPWFIGYIMLRTIATFGQLYVLSSMKLGQTMAIFGASSIIIANILGFLVLREALSPTAYIGVSLAVGAFIVLALR